MGGVETIVMSLARGLAELHASDGTAKFSLTVITQTPRGNFDDSQLPFPVMRSPSLWKLMRIVRASDVLHVAGPSLAPVALGLFARKPVVIEHHGYQAICPNGLLIHQPEQSVCPGYFQARAYSECLRCRSSELSRVQGLVSLLAAFPRKALVWRAAANIAITEHVHQRLAAPRTSVVYYGIDPISEIQGSSFAPAETFRKIRFAYVGRFVPEKGIPVLLSAVAELHKQGLDFEVVLIGDGPERPKIEAKLDAENLRSVVSITGSLSGATLTAAVSDVQVVIMPSVWEETAGLSAMEQLMRGRLVIASDIGGLAEIVGDTGMKFPAGDSKALAACMKTAIENSGIIEQTGALARIRAQKEFKRSRMVNEHVAIYESVWNKA